MKKMADKTKRTFINTGLFILLIFGFAIFSAGIFMLIYISLFPGFTILPAGQILIQLLSLSASGATLLMFSVFLRAYLKVE